MKVGEPATRTLRSWRRRGCWVSDGHGRSGRSGLPDVLATCEVPFRTVDRKCLRTGLTRAVPKLPIISTLAAKCGQTYLGIFKRILKSISQNRCRHGVFVAVHAHISILNTVRSTIICTDTQRSTSLPPETVSSLGLAVPGSFPGDQVRNYDFQSNKNKSFYLFI